MKKFEKITSVALIIVMILAVFSGCGNKVEKSSAGDFVLDVETAKPEEVKFPLTESPVELTVATYFTATSAGKTLSMNEIECFKEMAKRSGVHVDFQTTQNEKMALLFASDNLPDMVFGNWSQIGGVVQYADNGQIIPLDELISKYNPNFVNVLKESPDIKKQIAEADGKIYYYPMILLDKNLRVCRGFQIRQDWLRDLGIKAPTTIDEYYDMLVAFKNSDMNGNGKADEIPFVSVGTEGLNNMMDWWGIDEYYLEDGKVKCGWLTDEYKDYLSTLAKWYKEGLIDPDYITVDKNIFNQRVSQEICGSWYGLAGGCLGKLSTLMADINPEFYLIGQNWLSKDGQNPKCFDNLHVSAYQELGYAITSACKDPVLASKWIDYGYGADGNLLFNFGIEGESYTLEDGIPVYTDEITNNSNGLSMQESLARYAVPGAYSMEQSIYYYDQYMAGPQRDAIDIWKQCDSSSTLPVLKYTVDENDISNVLANEILTYVSGFQNRVIVGKESIENYEQFVSQLKSMGIDEVVKVKQTAYDRYIAQ